MRKQFYLLAGMLLLFSNMLFAQSQREVTGKVTDANGAPISGATIKVKNQRGGTVASYDGSFKILAVSNAVLEISAVGFETKEISTGNSTTIAIQLVQDTRAMNEVVVTG